MADNNEFEKFLGGMPDAPARRPAEDFFFDKNDAEVRNSVKGLVAEVGK